MLRDCIRDESIARLVLEGPLFAEFFHKVEVTNFEVASDAFTTFKVKPRWCPQMMVNDWMFPTL